MNALPTDEPNEEEAARERADEHLKHPPDPDEGGNVKKKAEEADRETSW